MAYKNYKIRDNWLDIDKYNDVDIQSVDGVIQTIKVNGQDAGGGSGDFSTATVIFHNLQPNSVFFASCFSIADDVLAIRSREVGYATDRYFTVPLYKGKVLIPLSSVRENDTSYTPTVEGNATMDMEAFAFVVTGDCTISAKGMTQG